MLIYYVNSVDVDNDNITLKRERTTLSWEGLKNINILKKVFAEFNLKTTWFVRIDEQIRVIYGEYDFLLKQYNDIWDFLKEDEIGWHPHLYSYNTSRGQWEPDPEPEEQLKKIFAYIKNKYSFKSVRIGEAHHSNGMMNYLSSVGFTVDSTAIPGRLTWGHTPNYPYHPSKHDYSISSTMGEDNLSILEVPMTTVPVRTSYDKKPLLRYINLSFKKDIFKQAIDGLYRLIRDQYRKFFLVTIIHPDEILIRDKGHALYSFSIDDVKKNIYYLFDKAERQNFKIINLLMKEIPDYYE